MKQQERRAARVRCEINKRLKQLEKAYLLCIILSWFGWSFRSKLTAGVFQMKKRHKTTQILKMVQLKLRA